MVNNNKFCQALSDTLEKEIVKPANVESTAMGACKVAMIASGEKILDIKNESKLVYKPDPNFIDAYMQNYVNWKKYLLKSIKN